MAYGNDTGIATQARNQAGCPYLHQTGRDAVQNWAYVLASIELVTLPADLQLELQDLRLKDSGADTSVSIH
jgi:hypothetical protein